jgi:hypothetical protein
MYLPPESLHKVIDGAHLVGEYLEGNTARSK